MKNRKGLYIRKQVIGENALYFFIWLCVFLVPFMSAGLMSEELVDFTFIAIAWLKIIPFYLLFVLNNFVLFRYLHRKYLYWAYYLVSSLLIIGIFTLLEMYERSDVSLAFSWGQVGESIQVERISLSVFPWWGNMIAAVLMLVANNLICKFYRTMEKEEDAERLQRQNVQAEMYYLKHQINPHFMMNTLNNIHALIDIDAEAAKGTVIQLSDMMRYVVYDTGGNTIALKEDLKFIKNYIDLMRIRYTDDVAITYNYPSQLQGRVDIPPLIFIVYVENAFKHGVSYNSHSYINVEISFEDRFVVGRFENSINEQSRKSAPGIGLENVRKRLDLIYNDKYTLDIEDDGVKYCVTLKIPILSGDEMHSN